MTATDKADLRRAIEEVLESWETPDSPEAFAGAMYQLRRVLNRQIGSLGGSAKSKAKAKAAKANGKLGGRPKKTPKAKGRTSSGSNKALSNSHEN